MSGSVFAHIHPEYSSRASSRHLEQVDYYNYTSWGEGVLSPPALLRNAEAFQEATCLTQGTVGSECD